MTSLGTKIEDAEKMISLQRSNNFIDSYMLVFELFWRFWGRVGHD